MEHVSIEKFAILDFEASSLSAASWPTEIGLSWLANGAVQTWSSLIRPAPAWEIGDWSPQSAAVHGIALSELADAPDAEDVVETFLDMLGDRGLVSDAPEFEARWLFRLMWTCRVFVPLQVLVQATWRSKDGSFRNPGHEDRETRRSL